MAKWGPADLKQALSQVNFGHVADLLVDSSTADDAAVYRVSDEQAVVVTADFITPVCNDPYTFGAVAVANSMSDVYAMGGEVLVGINLCAFPNKVPNEVLGEILKGGAETMLKGGGVIAGGHTVKDNELKYGLAVVGLVHPQRIIRNAGAQVGDRLVLTKPVGSGAILANFDAFDDPESQFAEIFSTMMQLNKAGAKLMQKFNASAATDITGFGLAYHAGEMAAASEVTVELSLKQLPIFKQYDDVVKRCGLPAAAAKNRLAMEERLQVAAAIKDRADIFFDPQTSGGLLIAVGDQDASALVEELRQAGYSEAAEVGSVKARKAGGALVELSN